MLIRKANQKDAEPIATCLFLAMADIVYTFIGEQNHEKGHGFMLHFVEQIHNQYSYENCWVVEDNHEVVAAINVYNGELFQQLREPIITNLRNEFNRGFNFEDETQSGEYYIDTFAVKPERCNEGIGTKLLMFVIDEYVTRNNQTLGLLVDEKNPTAQRLYLKSGFKKVGTRELFGKTMQHLQLKS